MSHTTRTTQPYRSRSLADAMQQAIALSGGKRRANLKKRSPKEGKVTS